MHTSSEGSIMNYTIILDWKFVAALGATAVVLVLASKLDPSAAESVLIRAVEANECRRISEK